MTVHPGASLQSLGGASPCDSSQSHVQLSRRRYTYSLTLLEGLAILGIEIAGRALAAIVRDAAFDHVEASVVPAKVALQLNGVVQGLIIFGILLLR